MTVAGAWEGGQRPGKNMSGQDNRNGVAVKSNTAEESRRRSCRLSRVDSRVFRAKGF